MTDALSPRVTPVILCGGAGMRLWPLSRVDRPKPFVSLNGGETLLQETARRVSDPARYGRPIIVVSEEYGETAAVQLAAVGITETRFILEPCPRGTAPAIALAALAGSGDELLLVLPSDHVVTDAAAFHEAVDLARGAVAAEKLVTFGVRPDRAETGYGYILRGDELSPGVAAVEDFVEKPDAATAERYLADGRYLWNAGMFLFRARDMIKALRAHAYYLLPDAEAALAGGRVEHDRVLPEPTSFARSPSQSIDHAVMEKSERVVVVPVDMGWSDVGSWEALHAVAAKDAQANAQAGDVVLIDSAGSLVRSDGPLVVGVGIRDMVVVATERSVLIVPRGDSQRVKEAVEALIARGTTPPPELLGEEGEEN